MRNRCVKWVCGLVMVATLGAAPARADVTLPGLISHHMVLQRQKPAAIWGWADPGEKVTVSLGDQKKTATTDGKGAWRVALDAMEAGGPFELTVAGKNTITIKNVLVGEVWVCSGQSNMQFSVSQSLNAKEEIAGSNHPKIRLFYVPRVPTGAPVQDVGARWTECGAPTVGSFSAVAYYFGRHLHKELDGVPIGLIHSSWGGTRIEPWTPLEGFKAVDNEEFKRVAESVEKARASYLKGKQDAVKQYAAWLPKAQQAAAEGAPIPEPPTWPNDPVAKASSPTGLYNGMIHPLTPYAVRGAIWYQGESNRGLGMLYHKLMKAMIHGWRQAWGQKPADFPFYYVQLAPFNYGNFPSALPEIWEAQTATLKVPNTGMVVTTDIGDVKDIHPKNKQEVGRRLALWALARTYGKEGIVYSGPLYKSHAVEGAKMRITFDHVGGGLASRDGKPLTHFTIAGQDKQFVPAKATIDGDAVVVEADGVDKPVAVRFGWIHTAEPNLMNKEGLPASPFRTDDWPSARK